LVDEETSYKYVHDSNIILFELYMFKENVCIVRLVPQYAGACLNVELSTRSNVKDILRIGSSFFHIFSHRSYTLFTHVEHTIYFRWSHKEKPYRSILWWPSRLVCERSVKEYFYCKTEMRRVLPTVSSYDIFYLWMCRYTLVLAGIYELTCIENTTGDCHFCKQ
jgi:hypothetical protein